MTEHEKWLAEQRLKLCGQILRTFRDRVDRYGIVIHRDPIKECDEAWNRAVYLVSKATDLGKTYRES